MSLEEAKIEFASIAIAEFRQPGKLAIETISVTRNSCDLSGAWILDCGNQKEINSILDGKLLLLLNDSKELRKIVSISESKIVTPEEFLAEASRELVLAIELFQKFKEINEKEYADYMQISPAERKLLPKVTKKNLIEPNFSIWPLKIDLLNAESELEKMGKLGSIEGTSDDLRNVLASSRLIQLLINMWRTDETERSNRQYVSGKDASMTILPVAWLRKFG